MALRDHLGEQRLGVLASYQRQGIVHHVVLVYPRRDDSLQIFIPKGHALAVGSLATVHLDNRTGVDALDAELHVYRTSYKGRVVATDENWLTLEPVEFMLIHGVAAVERWREPGYDFPVDARPSLPLPVSPLTTLGAVDQKDHENKVGVLTTLARGQPHTTVLAFLTTEADDVFLICVPDTFKLHVLQRDPRCFFIIDERAKYTFEQSIHWNYTILETRAHIVLPTSPLYGQVRKAFILKNPWEATFFSIAGLTMLHLPRGAVVAVGEPRPLPH